MKVSSAFLTTMSGKLGGAVASTARGGIQYFRKLVIPRNPNTALQTAIRNAVSSAAALWRGTLTELQQQGWWDMADGGITGQGLFAKVNQPRIYAANSNLSLDEAGAAQDPVPLYFPDAPTSLSAIFDGITPVIDDSANTLSIGTIPAASPFTAGADPTNMACIFVYCTAGQNASRFSRQHPYRLVRVNVVEDELAYTPTAINLAALGIPTVTGRVFYVKVYVQDPQGGISVPQEYRVVCVA